MDAITRLAPQIATYTAMFDPASEKVRWLPHLLYFHPESYRSDVVNTDSVGFRYATAGDRRYSTADHDGAASIRLLVGSSTVFGIGATADDWTLPSRLNLHDQRDQPWLNFGGRGYNSTQELLLLTLYRHLLPRSIVFFSGFNNLGLARMPQSRQEDHGTFFNYHAFMDTIDLHKESSVKSAVLSLLRRKEEGGVSPMIEVGEQIELSADLTLRHLNAWKALAAAWGARITYILQPLSSWVRPKGCEEEEALFAEFESLGGFSEQYGDILSPAVNVEYAAKLERGAKELDINFVNISPILADSVEADKWLFVDRIHFTDYGHDFVAQKVLELI